MDENEGRDGHEEENSDVGVSIYVGSRKVQGGGRIDLPADTYHAEEGEYVDLYVDTGEEEFTVPDRPLDSKGRVSIPKEQRRLYEIETGDRVTVYFRRTGKTAGG